ncbi:uncharacterized protein LOC126748481 [Anthonomus grandis grandis]|uniref:uncharacterized protein LOC126748481 n=1 Tax=Anthonomus grandis grandis TaxID=2921223 RepID=UPI0021658C39|nr:uncharacterized protein LOC126748481 [Anthonomus grandis grandis]
MDFKQLKNKRKYIKGMITRIGTWVTDHIETETNVQNIQVRHVKLQKLFDDYDEIQLSIQAQIDETNIDSEDSDVTETLVYDLLAQLQGAISTKHSRNECPSGGCRACSGRHHTLLHDPTYRSFGGNAPSSQTNNYSRNGENRTAHSNQRQSSFAQQNRNQCQTTYQRNSQAQNTSHRNISQTSALTSERNLPNDIQENMSQPPLIENQSLLTNSLTLSTFSSTPSLVLLATAVVTIYDKYGVPTKARILLDSASQNSFVTENLVQRLNYVPYNQPLRISGISKGSLECNKMVNIMIHSNVYENQSFSLSCAVLPVITCKLPQIPINKEKLKIPHHFRLSDPNYDSPSEIDMLIGADLYYNLYTNDTYHLGKNLPVLINTYLGWVIAGHAPILYGQHSVSKSLVTCASVHTVTLESVSMLTFETPSLDSIMEKFWKIEELPQKVHHSEDDILTEEIFVSTTKVLPSGRYQVNLPLKVPAENLGDSFFIAQKRFENLEKKFKHDPEYFCKYQDFIHEYLTLGHAKIVPLSLSDKNVVKYFFPHHAVLNHHSTTTKFRVVFDGSCKSSSNLSINDIMHKGYQVQPELFDIICRFRTYKYVLTCDIEKMYRQIQINPSQTSLQNILWRDDQNSPLNCIELLTVTYGTNCAPFLATRVLLEIATQNKEMYPLASYALLHQFYVDDGLSGVDKFNDLKLLYNQLTTLLKSHGFLLHKWCSNSQEFLSSIAQGKPKEYDFNFGDTPNKVLGLIWNPIHDLLGIALPCTQLVGPFSKRTILSIIAQCYDPLGLLSPVIVIGKLIIQKLWMSQLDWDTEITEKPLIEEWTNLISNLNTLANLKIPRWLFSNKIIKRIEFHGFADASTKAYAACVYVRTIVEDTTVHTSLVSSKSRVCPLKVVSLPRLELCAMLLLSQLVVKLVKIFEQRITPEIVHLWSDSQIALCWIKSHPSNWTTFVANRVSQIQEMTSSFCWHHIRSADNPADLPSRGVLPQDIIDCDLWWHGPKFLKTPIIDFDNLYEFSIPNNIPEAKKTSHLNVENINPHVFSNLFSHFSRFERLHRSVAYILRFIHNSSKPALKVTGILSVPELQNSLKLIVKILQEQHFPNERKALLNKQLIKDKHILVLNPFIDRDGIIRVGGRLSNANVDFDQKHPMLLPSHNTVVSMMLHQEHIRLGHAGPQTVLSNFRLRFWPLNGLRETKRLIRKCVKCFRFRASPAQQIMSELPESRVTVSRPFNKVGVDYGGPFLIKSSNLRKAPLSKSYIAIFVCMATKSVHIELVTDVSTEGFISSLKRFIARRGNPAQIFSDNATNFLGASNQIKEIFDFFKNSDNSSKLETFTATQGIEFKFIPPRSPHWGGIWESAIKSVKYHIKRLIGESRMTYEQFSTILCEIEAILNSRPLSALSNDPNDLTPLTPGHFLIGTSLTSIPEKDITAIPENRLKYWQRCSQIKQCFWKRWTVDYFNRLQTRPKWLKPLPNLQVNDLVLIKEDDTPPLKWPLGRIIETMPGKDGKVRVVKLRTQHGVYTRSIAKVCPLPNSDSEESDLPGFNDATTCIVDP